MKLSDTLIEFKNYYQKSVLQEHEATVEREDTLRVSGFPYCGLKHVYTRMVQPTENLSFGSFYYTSIGTMTHELLQATLGSGKRIYGNWKCLQKNCTGKRWYSNINKCPNCRSVMQYVEISLHLKNYFPNLSGGHIDGVYKNTDGEYFIVDYKTSNVKTLDNPEELPYPTNVAQIKGYCALIELAYKIEIKGWILFYMARDNPILSFKSYGGLITAKEKSSILDKVKRYSDHYQKVMFCNSFDTVKSLVKTKPCKTIEQYTKEFGIFGGCPLSHICFDPPMLNKELNRAWENREPDFLTRRRPKNLKL